MRKQNNHLQALDYALPWLCAMFACMLACAGPQRLKARRVRTTAPWRSFQFLATQALQKDPEHRPGAAAMKAGSEKKPEVVRCTDASGLRAMCFLLWSISSQAHKAE